MWALAAIGVVVLVIVALFVPRLVGCIVVGCLLGGGWWGLFVPLAIGGLIIDVVHLIITFKA